MSRNGKVIVAMSGGVDSSVAAGLLKAQGFECVGVFMRVGATPEDEPGACPSPADAPIPGATLAPAAATAPARRLRHGCCSATDALDARSVADRLGIPFYALNFRKDFERIIDYFVDEYARARTPNPCVRCNIELKFGKLLRYADAMGAEFVATGHYARVLHPAGGPPRLARSANLAKDQSYVLFGVRREDIGRCLFPLGEIADKAEVRRLAAELGLRVHDKPDSQEICFVPGNDYRALLDRRRPGLRRPGELRDAAGSTLGRHEGVPSYTIGQRRGLGVALGTPAYVTRLDVLNNTVTLGPYTELLASQLIADNVNWLVDPPAIDREVVADIRIRHMHAPAPGRIRRLADDRVRAEFATAQAAVTPGQAAVFYDEEGVVLGGGWIGPSTD
ncbi:MAG TPA: tRNA 2-thiouridine(34) synthase MnmA [Phycisphaerae bacterium]|nr:tRNA 2-thiouridine(34) synthase MnmA [Phycisphaerae bacterium]